MLSIPVNPTDRQTNPGYYRRPADTVIRSRVHIRSTRTGALRKHFERWQKGRKAEIDTLGRFVIKSIGDDPNAFWNREVDPCCKAIEERLASEAKGIKIKPYRHEIKVWKGKKE